MNHRAPVLPVLLFILLISPGFAQEEEEETIAPSFELFDRDGDGTSDLVTVYDQADNSPNELVYTIRNSSTGEVARIEFGSSGDTPAHGDYDGDGVTDLAVVREGDENFRWIIRNEDEENTSFPFGVPEDYLLVGCDFDRDGSADPAVYRPGTGIMYANAADETESLSIDFGETEEPTHFRCADFTGDGATELLFALRSEEGYRIALFTLDAEEHYSFSTVSSQNLLIADLNGDDLLDFALFQKVGRKGRRARLEVFTNEGELSFLKSRSRIRRGKRVSEAVAVYDGENDSWEILYYGRRNRFFAPSSRPGRLTRTDITPLAGDSLLTAQGLQRTSSSAIDDPDGRCPQIEDMQDGAGGRLWKHAENGGTVALFPKCDYTTKRVRILYQGDVLAVMEDSGDANPDPCGNRDHFRLRSQHPSSFPSGIILEVTTTRQETYCYQISGNTGKRVD
ncbi:VCBS repeat-containing protein [bacterium]|nr:VCBS repeat-containing protein [bacterium]